MFKRLAVAGATAALLFGSAVPALALTVNVGVGNGDIEQSNFGGVVNSVHTSANSGRNANFALAAGVQGINSGSASSASLVSTQLNTNLVTCGCAGSAVNLGVSNGDIEQRNVGFVYNHVHTNANTGGNLNAGGLVLLQGTKTGVASSVSVVDSIVNYNQVGPN
ncbi:MAG: hypothetical protein HY344_02175 [Candidatus Levybacteria bacterium]|nr:hypothetical protein [Candidatus Levybacteria bacterium]